VTPAGLAGTETYCACCARGAGRSGTVAAGRTHFTNGGGPQLVHHHSRFRRLHRCALGFQRALNRQGSWSRSLKPAMPNSARRYRPPIPAPIIATLSVHLFVTRFASFRAEGMSRIDYCPPEAVHLLRNQVTVRHRWPRHPRSHDQARSVRKCSGLVA
jgi:hypothetical protein